MKRDSTYLEEMADLLREHGTLSIAGFKPLVSVSATTISRRLNAMLDYRMIHVLRRDRRAVGHSEWIYALGNGVNAAPLPKLHKPRKPREKIVDPQPSHIGNQPSGFWGGLMR